MNSPKKVRLKEGEIDRFTVIYIYIYKERERERGGEKES